MFRVEGRMRIGRRDIDVKIEVRTKRKRIINICRRFKKTLK